MSQKVIALIVGLLLIILSSNTDQKNSSKTSAKDIESTSGILISPTVTPLTFPPISHTPPLQGSKTQAKVVKIVDGDTIEVEIEGAKKTLRYIGIDTPETVDPRRSIGCFGIEAKERNKQLVENQIVTLEKDISETDKYGRLLRYVYVGDVFVNHMLVAEGFANASSYPPDVKYNAQFKEAERSAQTQNKGLWSSCTTSIKVSPTPYVNLNTCQYSCSGPDRDCSDFVDQTDAQTFFTCCGYTIENDPMNLDNIGTGDGIVCQG